MPTKMSSREFFDEGISIMNYELSHEQLMRACLVYLQSNHFPSSVYEKGVYKLKIKVESLTNK